MQKSLFSQEYRLLLRRLRQARKDAGFTQADLAKRLGETQSFISKCERGERRLDVLELRAFCEAVGVPLPRFLDSLPRSSRGQKS